MTRQTAITLFLLCGLLSAGQFSMVVLGDRTGNAREDVFEQILTEVRILKPDLLLNVGDLIEGYTSSRDSLKQEWDTIIKLLNATGVPYHLTPGNHDISDTASEAYYLHRIGSPYNAFNYGDCHFVVVDNSRWDSAGAMPGMELAWLRQDLEANRNARLTFVFMHRSFWNAARRSGKTERLHELFKANGVDYVFSGHDHYYCRTVWDGITYIQLGPSGSRYKVYDQEERGAFQNYLLVNVTDAGARVTVMKPGGVLPADCVSLDDEIQLDTIDEQGVKILPVPVPLNQPVDDSTTVTVANITRDVLACRCVWVSIGSNWQIEPETVAVAATSLTRRTSQYHVQLAASANPYPLPELTLSYPYGAGRQYRMTRMLPIRQQVPCPKIEAPRLDGNLNDRGWKRLRPIRSFGTSDGKLAPTEPLVVYFGHDDTMLYFAARCIESQMEAIRSEATERDSRVADDDNVNFLLCPNTDSSTYYQLIVNPSGTIWDRQCRTENGHSVRDSKWNGAWQVATGRGSDFWTVEIAVPLREFGSPLAPHPSSPTWGLNIARFQARNQTVGVFQAPFAHDVKQMASLQFTATAAAEMPGSAGTGSWLDDIWNGIRRTLGMKGEM